jgi:hypothetical protein
MGSDSKRTVSFTMESPEQKQALDAYARGRGFTRLSEFCRVAIFEYVSRRPPRGSSESDRKLREALGDL